MHALKDHFTSDVGLMSVAGIAFVLGTLIAIKCASGPRCSLSRIPLCFSANQAATQIPGPHRSARQRCVPAQPPTVAAGYQALIGRGAFFAAGAVRHCAAAVDVAAAGWRRCRHQ